MKPELPLQRSNTERPMPSLSVIILTYNEAPHLARALRSVADIACEVFVIDSGSTDETVSIARAHGAVVLHHEFVNQAQQFQWALDNAPLSTAWIMRLDADEIIEPALARELAECLPALPDQITGLTLKRKHVFMGRWIKHGGRYPLMLLRVWRRGAARVEDRWMDEHIILTHGRAIACDGDFADINLRDLHYFIAKHNAYATREAVEAINQRLNLFPRDDAGAAGSAQAMHKRGLKERFYNRLPFGVGPTLYFLYRYLVQLGFLDGVEGAIYHGLQGFWYRFLVDAKRLDLERALAGIEDKSAKLALLAKLTGLKLPHPATPPHALSRTGVDCE